MELFGFTINRKAKQPELTPNQLYSELYRYFGQNIPLPNYSGIQDTINRAYLINEKVYSIINRIIRVNKGVPFQVYEITNPQKFRKYSNMQSKEYRQDLALQLKDETLEETYIQGLSDILKKPNNYQTSDELEEDLSGFLLLTGNAYLYGGVRRKTQNAPSIELYSMPAHLVKIVFGNWMNPIAGYQLYTYGLDTIEKNDVEHLKYWNPDYNSTGNQLYGMPPIRAAWRLIQSDSEGLNSQLNAFLNQGAKGFIHPTEGGRWTQTQAQFAKDSWSKAKGSDNSGKMVFLDTPIGFTNIGLSPTDLAILQFRQTTMRDLCNIYNVPAQLFNDPTASTYNNIKEARKSLIIDAALPLKEQIKGLLNRFLIPQWNLETNKNLYIDYDLSAYTELSDDLDSLYNRVNNAQFMSYNEKRELVGLDRIENDILDEPLMPMGMIPLSEFGLTDQQPIA